MRVPQALEYTYDNVAISGHGDPEDSGVTIHAPYYTDPSRTKVMPLRARLVLGRSQLSARASHKLLRGLAATWIASDYDLVERNCHHWCCEAAAALGVAPPPYWVLRIGNILKFFSGLPSERERARLSLKKMGKQYSGTDDDDDEGAPLLHAARGAPPANTITPRKGAAGSPKAPRKAAGAAGSPKATRSASAASSSSTSSPRTRRRAEQAESRTRS